MNNHIRVSVIVPVYNAEKTLDKCIESLLNQTYKPYEIILIDDGSKDKSADICDDLSNKHDIISVIHKTNEGLGFARNTGIEKATGDSILFLDSDDYFGVKLIEHLVDSTKAPSDTVISGYVKVTNKGEQLFEYKYDKAIYEGAKVKSQLLCRMMGSLPNKKDAIDMGATHVLYNLSIIIKNGIRFPSEREMISEDAIFNILYYQHADRVILTSYADYYYVTTPGSLTCKYREDRFEKSVVLFKEECRLLKKNGLLKEARLRLQKTFFNYLKMAIVQEKRSISNKKSSQIINAIKRICHNEVVRKEIDNYPINQLGIKQRIFCIFIKYNMCSLLFIANELGFL